MRESVSCQIHSKTIYVNGRSVNIRLSNYIPLLCNNYPLCLEKLGAISAGASLLAIAFVAIDQLGVQL